MLHIIRHGESEYNAATNGPRWEDPEIFDAQLTDKGIQQVRSAASGWHAPEGA